MKYNFQTAVTTLGLFFATQSAWALFCPTNFNQINPGDTIEHVQQQCGDPTTQKTYDSPKNTPQEWNYYVKPSKSSSEATLKLSIAFANNKVINMSVSGTSLTTTQICGKSIQLGDSLDTVKAACGTPVLINQSQPQPGQPAPQPDKMTEFTYQGATPVTLVFENGKLQDTQ